MPPSIHELDGIWAHAGADEHGAKQEPLIALEAWTQRESSDHLETRLKGNPSQDLPEAMADECFQNGAFVEAAFGTVK